MNAIRAALEAKERAADAERFPDMTERDYRSKKTSRDALPSPLPPRPASSAVQRFRESMTINYERWHDGIGYELEILKTATPEELVAIEGIFCRTARTTGAMWRRSPRWILRIRAWR